MAGQEVSAGTGPWIETGAYTTPLYTVPCNLPKVGVELANAGASSRQSLQAAFRAVPIPADARPASGTDGHMTIWQPSTDKLWEFWRAAKDPSGGWHASYGGAMQHVSQGPGYYSGDSWPGAAPEWGATATSLPVIGGTILLGELQRGSIDHALAIDIPGARAGVFSWPAQRSDGIVNSPTAIPEGARFRLDPNLDIASLHLPPLVRMMAEAAQRYGIVVRDQTGTAIDFFVEDTTLQDPNPFWNGGAPRADGYLQGTWPHALMAQFPWDRLQLLRMNLCVSSPCG